MTVRWLVTLAGLLLLRGADEPQLHGTAALVIWTPKRIIMAADSKLLTASSFGTSDIGTICKIREFDGYFVSAAGYYGSPKTDFDIWQIASSAAGSGKTVLDVARRMEQNVRAHLQSAIANAKAINRSEFERQFGGQSYVAFFVAGTDNRHLVVSGRDFLKDGSVLTATFPTEQSPRADSIEGQLFGERLAIEKKYPTPLRTNLIRSDPIAAARKFINAEIDEEPDKVGPPITVLEITRAGHSWVDRGVCDP